MSNWFVKDAEDWLEQPMYNELKRCWCSPKSFMRMKRCCKFCMSRVKRHRRKAAHPQAFLKAFKGWLHTDGHGGYHKLSSQVSVVDSCFYPKNGQNALKTGAEASAIVFSLLETAKENGLNLFKYLSHIFRHDRVFLCIANIVSSNNKAIATLFL